MKKTKSTKGSDLKELLLNLEGGAKVRVNGRDWMSLEEDGFSIENLATGVQTIVSNREMKKIVNELKRSAVIVSL